MTRRQRHLVDIGRIPRAHDQAARIRITPDHVDDVGNLVDAASVRRRPRSPLASAHSFQIETPLSLRYLMLVSPARNHNSSCTMDLSGSFLVVSIGKPAARLKRI